MADNPEDWKIMRGAGVNGLRCPEKNCTAIFNTREITRTGTRVLVYASNQGCGHNQWVPTGGGGPMTAEHLWLQRRLMRMIRMMNFEAIEEHPPTRADVYVPRARLAIEVQLRRTQFKARSAARQAAGATGVLWMLSSGALTAGQQHHLFEQPAVRWRAKHRDRKEEVHPWRDPSTNRDARVYVYGTVVLRSSEPGKPFLVTGEMNAYQFLEEVLNGERSWVPPGTEGMPVGKQKRPAGGWVRHEDLHAAKSVEVPVETAVEVVPVDHAAHRATTPDFAGNAVEVAPEVAQEATAQLAPEADHGSGFLKQARAVPGHPGVEPLGTLAVAGADTEVPVEDPSSLPSDDLRPVGGWARRMLRWISR